LDDQHAQYAVLAEAIAWAQRAEDAGAQ